jgi:biopolymer transport protein TolQ
MSAQKLNKFCLNPIRKNLLLTLRGVFIASLLALGAGTLVCEPTFAQSSIKTENLVEESGTRAEVAEEHHLSSWDLIGAASPVVKLVLLLLVMMSVSTWGIIISKTLQLRTAKAQTEKFSEIFWGSRVLSQITEAASQLKQSPVVSVYTAGQKELAQVIKSNESRSAADPGEDIDTIERALRRAKVEEITRLENGTTFLATTASAAPFIGLFGTVWGIMNAFIGLSHVKSSSIQAVAPGISEALIATAIGLAAAIPAAIAFNYFMQQVKVLSRNMDMFSSEFLNIARRHFLK